MKLLRAVRYAPVLALLVPFSGCSASDPADEPSGSGDGDGDGDIGSIGDGDGDGFGLGLEAPPNCGDGNLNDGEEACDDGNREDGDGCQANCLGVESGFICREAGEPCEPFARCGDGVVAFPEQCDDSNLERGDGCSPTCRIEVGWKCDGGECTPTTCGDGVVEGAETCDNGPDDPDDDCSPACVGEPDCSGGACTSQCGDGVVIGEACDDGNLLDGDGCSSACEVEPGYDCSAEAECDKDSSGNCILTIPAVFRDFDMSTHPDFHANSDLNGNDGCDIDDVVQGRVEDMLSSSGKPVSTGSVRCSEDLNSWYVDGPNNVRHVGALTLFSNGDGGFVNRWGENGEQWSYTAEGASPRVGNPSYEECQADGCVPCPWNAEEGCDGTFVELDGTPFFFPVDNIEGALDGGGFEAKVGPAYGPYHGWPTESTVLGGDPVLHNFHFTTEVTYWFPFEADTDATLDFTGDDDVWVFVNGKLAVDLGNTHAPENGSVTLTGTTVSVDYDVEKGTVTPFSVPAADFGLEPGNIYEIKVFHAERKRDGSSFRLTLDGFNATRSECVPTCGDGIIGYGEECDDGENNGGYNACQSDCTLGAYCGDGIVQEDEACDDADPNAPGNCSGCSIVTVR